MGHDPRTKEETGDAPRWSEDRLHRWLARQAPPAGLTGSPLHDAAVLAAPRDARTEPVLCVDQCIEGVHFEPGTPWSAVGRKAANRSLSDLAATAARPVALLLAVRAPHATEERDLRVLLTAVRRAARAMGADLAGGDLAAAPGPLSLAVTAYGVRGGTGLPRRALGRDRARVGQAIVLTGPVGGSRAGRHLRFVPRIALGAALEEAGATAAMDVSDGLAWDLHRLARASGVELELDLAALPIHRDAVRAAAVDGRSALDHALHDGEDHELVATLAPRAAARFCADFTLSRRRDEPSARGASPRVVGRVTGLCQGGALVLREGETSRLWRPGTGGWTHGA
jgi:thiamine-monophosphate kinase